MAQNEQKLSKTGQHLEIYGKLVHKILMNFNAFIEVEVLLTTHFNFVTRKKTQ